MDTLGGTLKAIYMPSLCTGSDSKSHATLGLRVFLCDYRTVEDALSAVLQVLYFNLPTAKLIPF